MADDGLPGVVVHWVSTPQVLGWPDSGDVAPRYRPAGWCFERIAFVRHLVPMSGSGVLAARQGLGLMQILISNANTWSLSRRRHQTQAI